MVCKAASPCGPRDCFPRDVYARYWDDLEALLRLPGKAYRAKVGDEFTIPPDALEEASPFGTFTGLDPKKLPGIVHDDRNAKKSGNWSEGTGLKGYVGYGYLYAGNNSGAACTWELTVPEAGRWEVRVKTLPVSVSTPAGSADHRLHMTEPAPLENGFVSVGKFELKAGDRITVTIGTQDAGGNAHADAVQLLKVE